MPGHLPSYKRLLDSSFYSFRFSASFNPVSPDTLTGLSLMMLIQLVKLFHILCHIRYNLRGFFIDKCTCLMLFSGKIEEANLSCKNLFCNRNINEFQSLVYQLKRHV